MPDVEHRSAVCTFNVEPSLKAEFYSGLQDRGQSATFLFRRLMKEQIAKWAKEDTQDTAA